MARKIRTRRSVIAQRAQEQVSFRAGSGNHAALARGNCFSRMKTETTHIAKRAGVLASIPTPESAGSVFDDPDTVLVSQTKQWRHVGAKAEQVNRDQADGARGNECFDLTSIYVEGREIDITEDRAGPHIFHDVGRCH